MYRQTGTLYRAMNTQTHEIVECDNLRNLLAHTVYNDRLVEYADTHGIQWIDTIDTVLIVSDIERYEAWMEVVYQGAYRSGKWLVQMV